MTLTYRQFSPAPIAFCNASSSWNRQLTSSSSFFCPVRPFHPQTCNQIAKRARMSMNAEIDGGGLPESNEPTPEVEYFSGSAANDNSATTPDFLPSSLANGNTEDDGTTEIPLFPLRLVLNPNSIIPLNIFESRYRLMFNKLRDQGNGKFGIVLFNSQTEQQQKLKDKEDSKEGSPDNNSNKTLLALVGCTAEVLRYDPLPDGRIITNNIGRRRFRIVRIVEEKPYIRARVAPLSDDKPKSNILPLIKDVWTALQDVLRLSNKLYDKGLDLSADIKRLAPGENGESFKPTKDEQNDIPDGWPSPSLTEEFSFVICQVLDMPLKEQQILLQLTDTGARLKRQLNMLSTARQYLAAQVTIKEAGLKGF